MSEPLTLGIVNKCIQDLSSLHGTTVVDQDDPKVGIFLQLLKAGSVIIPEPFKTALHIVQSGLDGVSVTFWLPGIGKVVYLARTASQDPVDRLSLWAHELTHVTQIEEMGVSQAASDYLGSGHLRAQKESNACGAQEWARKTFGGELVEAGDVDRKLARSLYHLDPDHLALGAQIARSHLDSIASGELPPVRAAMEIRDWFKSFHPNVRPSP